MNQMAEQITEIDNVVNSLNEIQADATVPRNVRMRIESIANTLREKAEVSIRINKAVNELDELANDVNLQSYTRTQIWNAMSVLEKL